MDNIKIGYFIAERRKEKQITQQQLADKLNITNKAISKWETGNGLPDITLLTELANILDVSVDEILKAKMNEKNTTIEDNLDQINTTDKVMSHNSDMVIHYLVHRSIDKFKMMAIVSLILSSFGLIIQYPIWEETKDLTGWIFGCWLSICGGGIYYYYKTLMKNHIGDFNATSDTKLNDNDISKHFLVCLRVMWVLIAFTLICYL